MEGGGDGGAFDPPWSSDTALSPDGLRLNVWYRDDLESIQEKAAACDKPLPESDRLSPISVEVEMNQVLLRNGSLIQGGGYDGVRDKPSSAEEKGIRLRSFRLHMYIFFHEVQRAIVETWKIVLHDKNKMSLTRYCRFGEEERTV
jgi:hypothetical protein